MKTSLTALCTLLGIASLSSASAHAGPPVPGDQLKAMITGKTLFAFNHKTGKSFAAYEAADGSHNVINFKGERNTGKWWINEAGKHCVESTWFSGCYHIHNNDGVFEKMDDGVVTHTIKEIRDGDQRDTWAAQNNL